MATEKSSRTRYDNLAPFVNELNLQLPVRAVVLHVHTQPSRDAFCMIAGAVMFRGFAVEEARDFEEVVLQFQPNLSTAYRGTSPRKLIPGTRVSSTSWSSHHPAALGSGNCSHVFYLFSFTEHVIYGCHKRLFVCPRSVHSTLIPHMCAWACKGTQHTCTLYITLSTDLDNATR